MAKISGYTVMMGCSSRDYVYMIVDKIKEIYGESKKVIARPCGRSIKILVKESSDLVSVADILENCEIKMEKMEK